jgi:hypothetical protein
MNWKLCGMKQSWLKLRHLFQNLPRRTEKNREETSVRIVSVLAEIRTGHTTESVIK